MDTSTKYAKLWQFTLQLLDYRQLQPNCRRFLQAIFDLSDIELVILGHIKFRGQEVALNKMRGEDAFGSRLFEQDRKSVVESVTLRLNNAGKDVKVEYFVNFDDKTLKLAQD